VQIHQDELRSPLVERADRLCAVGRLAHLEADLREELDQPAPVLRVIVGDEHPPGGARTGDAHHPPEARRAL
jgi:hypothetical protein